MARSLKDLVSGSIAAGAQGIIGSQGTTGIGTQGTTGIGTQGTQGIQGIQGISAAVTYSASITSNSWVGSDPYTQNAAVTGLSASDTIILDLDLSTALFSEIVSIQTAYSLVYRAVSNTNQIELFATDSPMTSFNIFVTVI